jgi:hypothetical protein
MQDPMERAIETIEDMGVMVERKRVAEYILQRAEHWMEQCDSDNPQIAKISLAVFLELQNVFEYVTNQFGVQDDE